MSGIVNKTGAVSGVIGTTVGTPSGHVLQTISDTDTGTQRTTSSTGWVNITGLQITFTSTVTNSRVFIMAGSSMSKGAGDEFELNIYREVGGVGTNELISAAQGWGHKRTTYGSICCFYLDSPTHTSGTSITYALRMKSQAGNLVYWLDADGFASLLVQEIQP